jgi:hypothetical protein
MLKTNIVTVTTIFLYECIFTKFGCALHIVTNCGVHFINDVIKHLIDHFLLNISIPLFIIHRGMVRQSPLPRCWEHCLLSRLVKIK